MRQTFRIGRGVKKTDAIAARKMNSAINEIWLFAGEGALYQRKPLPQRGIRKIIAICVSGHLKTRHDGIFLELKNCFFF